jgi:hypothetical protein
MVQKVQLRSAKRDPVTNPGDFSAWRRERNACRKNEGRKRTDRTRRRVRLTNTIGALSHKRLCWSNWSSSCSSDEANGYRLNLLLALRVASHCEIDDLPDQLGVGEAGFLRGHGELLSA